MILTVILSVIAIVIALIFLTFTLQAKWRKKECSDWKVKDLIAVKDSAAYRELQKHNKNFAILLGWDLTHIYLDLGDNSTWKLEWSILDYNKSAAWRRNHESCKQHMGSEPGFKPDLVDASAVSGEIDGKPIEFLSEIECEVYLKQAVKEENYEMAEKIRKRLEKFR